MDNCMSIENMDKTMLEKLKAEFDLYEDGQTLFDNVGFVLAEYFYDVLLEAYNENPKYFTNLVGISVV